MTSRSSSSHIRQLAGCLFGMLCFSTTGLLFFMFIGGAAPAEAVDVLPTDSSSMSASPDPDPTVTSSSAEPSPTDSSATPSPSSSSSSAEPTPTETVTTEPPPDTRPNIVLFITDDQAEGTLDAMPTVRGQLKAQGATLNGIIPTSICCPSRAALLSGQYARTTGVYENTGPRGGWPTFYASGAEDHTIATALDESGYYTGMFGKYLNGFAGIAPQGYVPPGWDEFRAIHNPTGNQQLASGAYYNYYLRGTDQGNWYGDTEADYSTDVITKESVQFIRNAPADKPLFLYYSTTGPHSPWTPAPRHEGTWPAEPLNQAAITLTKGRPSFMPDTTRPYETWVDNQRRAHEALMSVDEGINSIINELGTRAENTLFIYLSDNGLQFAEHGLTKKNSPYSGSTDVPMFLRWDGVIAPGSTSSTPVTNADLTATMAEAASVDLVQPDGVSFFAADRPTGVVLEATQSPEHPAYCGYRTPRYMFVQYANGEREFYDYAVDPDELVNRVDRTRYATRVQTLKDMALAGCNPTPYGFDWSTP